jgi:hypothetical protein
LLPVIGQLLPQIMLDSNGGEAEKATFQEFAKIGFF